MKNNARKDVFMRKGMSCTRILEAIVLSCLFLLASNIAVAARGNPSSFLGVTSAAFRNTTVVSLKAPQQDYPPTVEAP